MKDILIVVSPSTGQHKTVCKAMLSETRQYGTAVRPIHDKAFLLSGPKSFEIAVSLARIAEGGNLQFVVCEVEAILIPSEEAPRV